MIVSVSRRTDIPSHYSKWLINRIKEGYVFTRNPVNPSQITEVSLLKDFVDCLVFWTKDPANMLEYLPVLDDLGHRYYFQFTFTPYGTDIETNLRGKDEIRETFVRLAETIGKDRVLWRYDPIVLNDKYTITYHTSKFEQMCDELSGYTAICTISFVSLYPKLRRAIESNTIREITQPEMTRIACRFSRIARDRGIEVRSCAGALDLQSYGIKPASCIDRATVERVCGYGIDGARDRNQRPDCNCIKSVDIGAYNTCLHGCVYCYANYSAHTIANNRSRHDPTSDILLGARIRR